MTDEYLAVFLIVNGPLNMSTGKIAAQSFQACQRMFQDLQDPHHPYREALERWQQQGTCTITRVARTSGVFERAARELPGVIMIDEGYTEVLPGSATIFATYPLDRGNTPRMLRHKQIPLLRST